jgi:hypothetical protein
VGDADDDGVPAAAFPVAGFGMGSRVPGELDEGFGAAVADRFGEHITIRIGLARKRCYCC